ncbi:hypothetical protein [Actinorugispora endophytica]|uniref:Uncharacterized protein n=1 Tax=Actinorugispora endophytica TaxID=1605990 RepID=A0A4R6UP72_9ACTN|nr:hypothetical protein [Actinorugispora endophytica]TDQ47253.1 hypothetical protein EV190_12272 [Actinorugispora endophytica]
MNGVRGNLVLRPNLGKGLAVLAVTLVASMAVPAAAVIGDAPVALAATVGALFAALTVLAVASLVSARVTLTPDEIAVRGLFSNQRRSRPRVAQVVRATITAPRGASGESLFLLDEHRGLVIRVNGAPYTREDLDRLVDALGVPCEGPDRPVDARQFARAYPDLVSRAEQHPYRIAFAAIAIVCVTIVAVLLIAVAVS